MARVSISGDVPNLRMLLEDLNRDPEFRAVAAARMVPMESDDFGLGNAHLATLVIDLALGLAGNATYDLLKTAVAAARRRGFVSTEGMEHTEDLRESTERPEV
ncbi:hypothetical protein GCM10010104_08190 [Streptomyces indiaensis]|uniref:Uncharacterized protein n=1 Tax=Streptomyces indiaensis TaxID=284033 RepID=A0ABP5PZN9_9ACTN